MSYNRSNESTKLNPFRMRLKRFGILGVSIAALFGLLSALILIFAPEKIVRVTNELSALGQKSYKLPEPSHSNPNNEGDVKVLKTFSKVFVNIAKQTRPALTFIRTKTQMPSRGQSQGRGGGAFPEEFFFPFFGGPGGPGGGGGRGGVQEGAGSGFIVDLKSGYVVTNNHVVQDATEISVKTFDDRTFKAKLVGAEKSADVAVLKLENFTPQSLKQVTFSDSDSVEVGDWVVALGAPFSLPQTLTVGVVSALSRGNVVGNNQAIEDFIQTDAAINPGNSGGPLLNLDGQVVGINSAISSPTGSWAGIGFAVPSNIARLVAEMLISDGKVVRGYLGVEGRDFKELSPDVLANLNVNENTPGALVAALKPGGPADKGGLKPYDIIQSLNGHAINSFSQLRTKVAYTKPGTEVKMGVLRDGKLMELKIKVGSFSEADARTAEAGTESGKANSSTAAEFGLSLSSITNDLRKQLGINTKHGVLVASVEEESFAGFAGLRRGDVIVEVNRKPARAQSDVESALKSARDKGKDLLFLIERNGRNQLIVLRLR